jgi:hypothetical protein
VRPCVSPWGLSWSWPRATEVQFARPGGTASRGQLDGRGHQSVFVIHFTRNVTRIQCIYELKFPCGYEVANPWTSHVDAQMKLYKGLDGQCPPVLVSPQRGLQQTR